MKNLIGQNATEFFNYSDYEKAIGQKIDMNQNERKLNNTNHKYIIDNLKGDNTVASFKLEQLEKEKENLLASMPRDRDGDKIITIAKNKTKKKSENHLPLILPPADSVNRRFIQYPHYCCNCEFRKKVLASSISKKKDKNEIEPMHIQKKKHHAI